MKRTSIAFGIVMLLAAPALAQSNGGGGGGGGGGGSNSGAGADPASVYAVHQKLAGPQKSVVPPKSPNNPRSRYRGREEYKVTCDGGLDYPAWYTIGGCRSYGEAR